VIALGIADAATRTPVTPTTRFEAASLSKPVFSRAWLAGVADGRLTLDRPLAADGATLGLGDDPRVAALTARQLLSHQGGLPNWRTDPTTRDVGFIGEPGAGLAYSGEGYDALARAMAHALRTDEAGLARHLAASATPPDAVARFGFRMADCTRGKAAPHRRGERLPWTPCPTHVGAAGGLEAAPADYARWLARVMAGDDLPPALDAAWWAGQSVRIAEDHPARAYGLADWSLGFAIHHLPFGRTWVHTGDQTGYTALALVAGDRRRALVVMTNADAAQGFLLELVGALATPASRP
jgi:CubicO group peptidase (beta-lactamase class C family)